MVLGSSLQAIKVNRIRSAITQHNDATDGVEPHSIDRNRTNGEVEVIAASLPAGAAIVIMLRSLKMPGMAQAVQDLHEQGSPAFEAAMQILSQLLKAEIAEA